MPAFPTGWPPRPASHVRSVRVYAEGTTTGDWASNAILFNSLVSANTFKPTPYRRPGDPSPISYGDQQLPGTPAGGRSIPQDAIVGNPLSYPRGGERPAEPQIWVGTLALINDGSPGDILEVSFDGVNIHGKVYDGERFVYRNRFEAGVALRLSGVAAVGSITTIVAANISDGEDFILDDGVNPAVTFEFDKDDSVVETDTLRQVNLFGLTTADQVRDAILAAIEDAPLLGISASNGGAATVSLVGFPGTASNVAIVENVTDVGFVVTGMASGTGAPFAFRVEGW